MTALATSTALAGPIPPNNGGGSSGSGTTYTAGTNLVVSGTTISTDASIRTNINVMAFGAKADGVEWTNGFMVFSGGNSYLTCPSAAFVAGDVGKVISVCRSAGTAGVITNDTTTTIAAVVSATNAQLSVVTTFVPQGVPFAYGSDDTAAFQSGLNAVAAQGGGTLYVPHGTYIINGGFVGGGNTNAVLYIPLTSVEQGGRAVTVKMMGDRPVAIDNPPTTGATVLRVTSIGTGSVLNQARPNLGAYGFANITASFENLVFRVASAQNYAAVLNLNNTEQCELENLTIETPFPYTELYEPTLAGYGIKLPKVNCGGRVIMRNVVVSGFNKGILISEHAQGYGVIVAGCREALVFDAGAYESTFENVQILNTPRAMVFTNGASAVMIRQAAIEHGAAGWQTNVFDVSDVSNYGTGFINWSTGEQGGVGNHNWKQLGGLYLSVRELGIGGPNRFITQKYFATSTTPTPPFAGSTINNGYKDVWWDDGAGMAGVGMGDNYDGHLVFHGATRAGMYVWTGTGTNASQQFSVQTVGVSVTNTDLRVTTGGKGIQIKTGANSRCETFTMTNGTVTVANTNVTVNTRLFLGSLGGNSATIGGALNYTINPTVGYTVNSFLGTDTNRVNVLLIEQIP